MYGLFRISFDYYCWEDLICVSAVYENLERYYSENATRYPLYSEEQSEKIKSGRTEEFHYVIKEVLEV